MLTGFVKVRIWRLARREDRGKEKGEVGEVESDRPKYISGHAV